MNSEDFAEIFAEQVDRCSSIVNAKAAEYATDEDRLIAFKNAAVMLHSSPAGALGGMMIKHTTSIYDMIAAGDTTQFSREAWDEKITDNMVYLFLLLAIVEEDRRKTVVGPVDLFSSMTKYGINNQPSEGN